MVRLHFGSDSPLPTGVPWVGAPVVSGGRLLGNVATSSAHSDEASLPPSVVDRVLPRDVAAVLARVTRQAAYAVITIVEQSRGPEALRSTLLPLVRKDPSGTVELVLDVARAFVSLGRLDEALVALDVLQSKDVQSTQLRALILSKKGQPVEAIALLTALVKDGFRDAETMGLLAASHKRVWLERGESARADLDRACDLYAEAYAATGDPYPGINAAALALYRGDRGRSTALAHDVLARLKGRGQSTGDHWSRATIGEALLLSGDLAEARRAYREAIIAAGEKWQDVAVMRRQARRNLVALGLPSSALDDVLPLPGVVGFSGEPSQWNALRSDEQRGLPSTSELRAWLRRTLDASAAQEGFSTAARGPDLVFIEEVLARGGKVSVFISEDIQLFLKIWVGMGWDGTFNELLGNPRVSVIRVPVDIRNASWTILHDCQRAAAAACAKYAALLDQTPRAFVAWWDAGAAADIRQTWSEQGVRVEGLGYAPSAPAPASAPPTPPPGTWVTSTEE
jgi:hypothetical protein